MDPKCNICAEVYHLPNNKPMVLPCGHTLCDACIRRVNPPQCSYCRRPFELDQVRENYELSWLIDDQKKPKPPKYFCSKHKTEPAKFLCLADKQVICNDCRKHGDHKGHDYKLISDILAEHQQLTEAESWNKEFKRIEELLASVESGSYITKAFEFAKGKMLAMIEDFFSNFSDTLNRIKKEIVSEYESYFARNIETVQNVYKNDIGVRKYVDCLRNYRSSLNELKSYQDFSKIKELHEKLTKHDELRKLMTTMKTPSFSMVEYSNDRAREIFETFAMRWRYLQIMRISDERPFDLPQSGQKDISPVDLFSKLIGWFQISMVRLAFDFGEINLAPLHMEDVLGISRVMMTPVIYSVRSVHNTIIYDPFKKN